MISINMTEIELGNLALRKSSDADVTVLATSLIHHLSQANESLKSLAAANKIPMPSKKASESAINALAMKAGRDFDYDYARTVALDCTNQIQSLRWEAGSPDPDLSSFADSEVAAFRQYLAAAQQAMLHLHYPTDVARHFG